MPDYERAIVRLTTPAGATAGLGVLVGPDEVLTCAHVVNTALGRAQREPARPSATAEVTVRFPLLEGSPVRGGTVVAWLSPAADGPGGDVAGLHLGEQAPPAAMPARFVTSTVDPGERLRVFGYPGSPPRANGAWVDLDMKGEVGRQLIQVESRGDQSIKAQPGYSGSPVWSDRSGLVVGLLHATAFADEAERDSYLIPGPTVAEAWEEQFDYLLVPPNPYRGLEPFSQEHAHMFFGRDADISRLTDLVRAQTVTTLIGPSGVGKSSLARAGLLPALLRDEAWSVAEFRPGPDPWQRLAAALLHAQHADDSPLTYDDARAEIERLRQEGIDPIARFLRSQGRPLLILVDQFEELLDAERPGDREFIDLLIPDPDLEPTDPAEAPARTLLTLRADFFDTLLLMPGMSSRLSDGFYTLSPLTTEQMHEAINLPAASQGVQFADGLLDQLTRESADGAMLPLVEFTLTQLWPTMRHKTLTHAGYQDLGGVTGALDLFADQQIAAMASHSAGELDRVLLRLVRAVPDADRDEPLIMKRRAHKSDLLARDWELLQHLADARLVITDRDATSSPYAELMHEALITAWQRLGRLVADNLRFLNWLADMEQRVTDGDLLPQTRLPSALTWLKERPTDIPDDVQAFVVESEAAAEEQARRVRNLEALTEVGAAVGSSLDLDEVLSTIVMSAVRTSGGDGGSMMQYNEAGNCFTIRTEYGTAPEVFARLLDLRIDTDTTFVGRAALEGRPAQIPDLAQVERDAHLHVLFDGGWHSLAVAPMTREGRLIGALVIRRKTTGEFSSDTVGLLETFASQSALVIYNAELFQELELKTQELQLATQYDSEFLARMSHDMRTSVNAVIGFSEVLLERLFGDLNDRQEEYLRDIWNSGHQLLELVNESVDVSRLEAGRVQLESATFSVRTALDRALALVRERAGGKDVELALNVAEDVDEIEADEQRFEQVVFNLVGNALKFTPEGGHVTVDAHLNGAELVVAVSDDGPGIPSEDQERIFESFEHGRPKGSEHEGTGLGLTLCRRIVDLFGGRMWVDSVEGRGSTFGFSVPLAQATHAPHPRPR